MLQYSNQKVIKKGVRHFLKQTENRTKHKLYKTTFHTKTDTTSTITRLVVTTVTTSILAQQTKKKHLKIQETKIFMPQKPAA